MGGEGFSLKNDFMFSYYNKHSDAYEKTFLISQSILSYGTHTYNVYLLLKYVWVSKLRGFYKMSECLLGTHMLALAFSFTTNGDDGYHAPNHYNNLVLVETSVKDYFHHFFIGENILD